MPLCVRMVLEALLLARNLMLCFVHMFGLAVEASWSTSIIACFEGCVLMVRNRRVCSAIVCWPTSEQLVWGGPFSGRCRWLSYSLCMPVMWPKPAQALEGCNA